MIDRADAFEADIAAAPDAMKRLLDGPPPPPIDGLLRIAFAGLGSSRYAALIAASALRARGRTAWVELASTSTPTTPAPDLAFVAISASGRTPEVVAAAERHRGTSLVIAVTNDPASGLAATADLVVPLAAGEEVSGIACRTFRATVAALALLTGLATTELLRPSIEALAGRIATRGTWLPPIVDALDRAPSIDVLADAALLGLAEQAALMLREGPRLSARASDTADWLHTGVYLAFPGHRSLLYPGSAADGEVVATIERRGGIVVRAVRESGTILERVLVESVVAELVAADLWRRATAIDKVT